MTYPSRHQVLCLIGGLYLTACMTPPPLERSPSNVVITAALNANDIVTAIRFVVLCNDGTALSADVALNVPGEIPELDIPDGHSIADLYAVIPTTTCEVTLTALDDQHHPVPSCTTPIVSIDVPANVTEEVVVVVTCANPVGEGISGCLLPTTDCSPEDPLCPWSFRPIDTPCNDGLSCTVGDYCDGSGVCGVAASNLCNDGIPCTENECDPVFGCIGIPTTPGCTTFCPKGDVNGNNSVDVVDAQCTIILALWQLGGMATPTPPCLVGPVAVADLDCFGTVNVADVLLIVSFALNQPLSPIIDRNNNGCHDHCDQKQCGDGVCTTPEDCLVCPTDCGVCPGSCCEVHSTPGCVSASVTDCVCNVSPLCCSVLSSWSAACVAAASQCNAGCP